MDQVRITADVGAAEILAAWPLLFPSPGTYRVARLPVVAKAATAGAGAEQTFDEWFLEQLAAMTRERARTAQEAIWAVLDRLLVERGVRAPSALDQWELGQRLFDLSHASTARLVGLHVPADVTRRLTALGWQAADVLDFPAIAYRIGRIYEALQAGAVLPWPELLARASARPLSAIEHAAIAHTRARAGVYLRPVFDAAGAVWTGERERAPLQDLVARAIANRQPYQAAARELAVLERAQGVFRDTERVLRTEIAEASGHGNWTVGAARFAPTQLMYRPTSATPCKACLRLLKEPNGMPRVFTRAEVERQDALGPNTGPAKDWHLRIGTIHVNCVCPPFQPWHESTRAIVGARAPAFAQLMRELRVFPEAA